MNDTHVSPSIATVNADPPAAGAPPSFEGSQYYLPDMIRLALIALRTLRPPWRGRSAGLKWRRTPLTR